MFSQNSILLLKGIEINWIKICVLHKNFKHISIAFLCTETKLKSLKPIHHHNLLFIESKKIFFVFVQYTVCELWTFI